MRLLSEISGAASEVRGAVSNSFPWKYLLVAFLIREVLAPFTGHPYDFEIWVRLGQSMLTNTNPYVYLNYVPGLSFSPYSVLGSIAYLPLSAYVFGGTYAIYAALGEPSKYLYYFLLKQPMVIADVLVAFLLYRIIRPSRGGNAARRAALIWLFLPFSVITSTLWGSLDSVVVFLTLLAVYLFQRKRLGYSALALAFAVFYKQSSLLFLPVFLLQKGSSWREKAVYTTTTLAIPAIGTLLPAYLYHWPLSNMFNGLAWQTVLPIFGAMSIFNPLVVFHNIPPFVTDISGSIWIPLVLISYYFIHKREIPLVEGMLITFLAFCILRPFLPENWTGYALVFLLMIGTRDSYLRFVTLSVAAQLFLVTNNTLLIRFFTPISINYFNWDLYLNNYVVGGPRYVLVFVFAALYFVEVAAVLLKKPSPMGRFGPIQSLAAWLTPAEV